MKRRPEYVDIEFAAWRRSAELRAAAARICRRGEVEAGNTGGRGQSAPQLILSHHDLSGTPTDISRVVEPMLAVPADVVKVVFTARAALDGCRVLRELERRLRQRKVIMLAMGTAGLITRVLARKCGAFLTFAALEAGRESATGQPTLRELIDVYRWRETGAGSHVFGVVGWPVEHSRSPLVHNGAMRSAGIDGVYVPLPVAPTYEAFAGFMDYITQNPELDIRGLSITVPHKEHALRRPAQRGFELSELAHGVGAVNTLTHNGAGGWAGENTDVAGFLAALASAPGARGRRPGWLRRRCSARAGWRGQPSSLSRRAAIT